MKKILPPTYFYICFFISAVFHFILPVKQIVFPPINYFGSILILAGSILNIWAGKLFKKHNTTVKPNEKASMLIDYGPFKFSRNPMYLGMALFLIGEGIFLGSLSSFFGVLIFLFVIEVFFIPAEEKLMEEIFGTDYKNYKTKVRRWI